MFCLFCLLECLFLVLDFDDWHWWFLFWICIIVNDINKRTQGYILRWLELGRWERNFQKIALMIWFLSLVSWWQHSVLNIHMIRLDRSWSSLSWLIEIKERLMVLFLSYQWCFSCLSCSARIKSLFNLWLIFRGQWHSSQAFFIVSNTFQERVFYLVKICNTYNRKFIQCSSY